MEIGNPITFIGMIPTERPLEQVSNGKLAIESKSGELKRLRRATNAFESLFLSHMLKSMRKTIGSSSGETTAGKDVMQDFGWEKVAESLSNKKGLGIGDMLYESLKGRIMNTAEPADSVADSIATEVDDAP